MTHADHAVRHGEGRVTGQPLRAHLPDKRNYAVAAPVAPPPVPPSMGQVRMGCNGRGCENLVFFTPRSLVRHVMKHRLTCDGKSPACR